ncbi:hypothetical protein MW887_007860 [Aspergillus wentii]|nr:hypothetical protein MW887_007860 [Aspergillus wentii]
MDLVGGVGQMPLQVPEQLTESRRQRLPLWLREASDPYDKGRNVSEKFLGLEKTELERMKQALSYDKYADNTSTKKFRVAGIEKGTKNRYNDIYPFDHSRVRLKGVPHGDCDYVNGNHMKAEYSNKTYIATQAPVPDTFNDFWRVVWEQDVRLIISLTAEVERGQVKCNPYWESGNYGHLQVKNFSQRHIYMNSPGSKQHSPDLSMPALDAEKFSDERTNETSENPCIIVRHFGLSHSAFPFQPLREVTQLQYPYWPDFGTTSQPAHLLKLVEQCDHVTRTTSNIKFSAHDAEPKGERPVLVHCSAGCGRTGTFCTVDSVLDMLKRQRSENKAHLPVIPHENPEGRWIHDEKLDLIAKTVADFRTQRPSMIQNLSQFVLCYESVLEWVVSQLPEDARSE